MSEELKTNQDGIKKPQTLDQLFSATGGVQDPREETPTVSLSGVYVLPDVNRVLDFKQVKEELVTDENGEKRRILVWEYKEHTMYIEYPENNQQSGTVTLDELASQSGIGVGSFFNTVKRERTLLNQLDSSDQDALREMWNVGNYTMVVLCSRGRYLPRQFGNVFHQEYLKGLLEQSVNR